MMSLVRQGSSTPTLGSPFTDFDHFFSGALTPFTMPFAGADSLRTTGWTPAMDVEESDEAYLVTAELPGLSKEDVEITVENHTVTISGERKWDESVDRNRFRRIERAYGTFSRSFTLPKRIEANDVRANFENGVLYLTLPKAADSRPRHIAIH